MHAISLIQVYNNNSNSQFVNSLLFQIFVRSMFCTKEGHGHCTYISVKNHDTQTVTGEFIYKTLTLHGKQLLLKRDQL